ncbi:TPA: phosphoethanolamine transferase CptA [Escherichia coli]|uniref:phosphoethanolamine transferase CptA n=2 Tax=Escherichia coli TaxID=562 RepID=UPI00038F554E|nr:phosphoethanolamine transferase CptA [Escherichia coli]HDQ6492505.1 phosphoethanolamine transferase CptA [Escherichia coli Ou:H16]EEV6002082.1 phosphoethanolamine transferase CptA [Escherichia coli]EEW2380773.1 phosphoethanolamine transferase CptA [Escherichia coli]EEZ9318072.1 phosphoethanolamine transferase CptA [Escherichia coli]EFH4090540.1 phosphoethanolamine transferase CptA [Escherichia coli]
MNLSLKQKKHTYSWKSLAWALLYFCFFSTFLQIIIFISGYSGTNGMRDSILFSTLWIIPILLFPDKIKIIAALVGIILWGTSLAALCYYFIYGHEFSQSVLFVIFETNTSEAGEFLSNYFSADIFIITLIYTALSIFLWTRLRPVYIPTPWRGIVCFILFYGLILHPITLNSLIRNNSLKDTLSALASRMEPAAPWQFISSYYQYRQQLNSLTRLQNENNAMPPLSDFKDISGNKERTLVMVIGESTQSGRMSLYGYTRKTTPELDKLYETDPNMTVFNNVITSRPYTIEALQQALTFADQENPDLYLSRPSLMNIMKQAGYKTFWITNQQTMTARNTILTVFSRQTDKQYYMNQQRTQSAREYDTNVFQPFREALNDPARKKFIIVHLLGTHIKYKYRYPENNGKFDGSNENVPPGLSGKELEIYNDYDNANLYNDHVVATLIKDFKAIDPNGFLLYFSDHGEEVYDTPPHKTQGRNEDNPTRNMYTIPFLLWTSEKWQTAYQRDFTQYANRKYSLADLIHTWSDLSGLTYEGYDPKRSIVNPQFKETIRWIGNPYKKNSLINYDSLPY